jgi:tetratricopeptide (TPR) repeat protein
LRTRLQFVAALLLCTAPSLCAQSGKKRPQTAGASATPAISSQVLEAEKAIAHKDYARAEALLRQAASKDPKNYRAWYDLAFVYKATKRYDDAIAAYQTALNANERLTEAKLELGELLVVLHREAEALPFLKAAAAEKPTAHAWMLLGEALEASEPAEAIAAYRKAAQTAPRDAAPQVRIGVLSERIKDFPNAEAAYKAALALEPKLADAAAGLANVYLASSRLPEAESALREYLGLEPGNLRARVQLGRVLAKNGKLAAAILELEAAAGEKPEPALQRELAAAYFDAKEYEKAAAAYDSITSAYPQDADVFYGLGTALMRLTRYAEAEPHLMQAIKLNPKMPETYATLAFVASKNNKYELAIRALDIRSQVAPDEPATFFLRATCYDHMKMFKEAAQNYKAFLQVAGGRFPDDEWKARHRLIAIEPKGSR